MNYPRLWHKLRAKLFGYFWLPCPICGEMFGGHESHGSLYLARGRGKATCWGCRAEAERLTQENVAAEWREGRLNE